MENKKTAGNNQWDTNNAKYYPDGRERRDGPGGEDGSLPLGFGMALAKNPDAMAYFSSLSDGEKRAVIDGTHDLRSKTEMQEYVNKLSH